MEYFSRLKNNNVHFIISEAMFAEIVTVLSLREGREFAVKVGERLIANRDIEILPLHYEIHQKTWEVFKNVERKNVSFIDCSVVPIIKNIEWILFLPSIKQTFALCPRDIISLCFRL
jgi:predicted nucleic acid-binding protein